MSTVLDLLNATFPELPTSRRLELVCEYIEENERTAIDFARWAAARRRGDTRVAAPLVGGRICLTCSSTFVVESLFSDNVCPHCGSPYIAIGYGR